MTDHKKDFEFINEIIEDLELHGFVTGSKAHDMLRDWRQELEKETPQEKSLFFTFNQNNSGGYFVEDAEHGICEYVIIESDSADNATRILGEIGSKVDGFDDYCSCCGERWSTWMDDADGKELPSIYDTPVTKCKKEPYRHSCFVHYLNGKIEEFVFPNKED